ncbi:glycosyltransferase family 4 protein [Subsaxibacter sp. CAU 1640]|uniref:glycosyltransferase family 4 protein n=1 Tax=Subsaxibacter sp. CAU 1640 TaxID=2933271 RepID=UPI002004B833|nr:glycosyltransferase family 4 protein [Subsaxibacter sp. CAU 1640]MCK7589885.1 glycosyltransferase family 4 protein [Subsaxibacter sp. CAU 1640]
MKSKKRILIITSEFPPQPGGIGNHAYNLALQLSRNDHPVTVIVDERSLNGEEESLFDMDLPFEVQRIKITSPRFLMYFKRLKQVDKSIKKVSTVIATGKFSLWTAAFFSLFFNRYFIAIIHGTEVNFKSLLLKISINLSLKRFNTVIAVSNYTKCLVDHLDLNIKVIPNGFNPDKFKSDLNKDVLPLTGYPKLITVGNVTERKGQKNVIHHLPNLIKAYPEIHYHCVGIKTEAAEFEIIAKRLDVNRHVTFHGRLSDQDLQFMLDGSDIFVMLSSETRSGDVEGFGIAILEANALGVPAIGASGCGIEDAIAVGKSGLLVDPLNQEAFLEAVATILNEKNVFTAGAKSWAEKHKWSNIINNYLECIP